MDIFSLRDSIIGEYRKFATSFTTIHAEDIRSQVEAIYSEGRFWPDPLLQINPSYKRGLNLETLISNGALDPRTADIFRADEAPLSLYKHQEQAVVLASQGESYVVTTGTGSGKSLCFFIPIVSAVLAEKRKSAIRRTRAIIIYPMTALANSQLEELDKFVSNVQGEKPITFARYTGQEDSEERRCIYDRFLQLVDEVCKAMPGLQVVLTTTTPPPEPLRDERTRILKLSHASDDDLLLKRRIENLLARAIPSSRDEEEDAT
jgi:ATP-dependent helicase YprA (DUF1998 family)